MRPLLGGGWRELVAPEPGPGLEEGVLEDFLARLLAEIGRERPLRRVLLVPPDGTRRRSFAGPLSGILGCLLGPALAAAVPATGTHRPMPRAELESMFPGLDPGLFRAHDHRRGNRLVGELPSDFLRRISGGRLSFPFPVELDEILFEDWDLVVSVGQVVPHEVAGMANYTKNLVVGLGGLASIDRSHWLGAVAGLENLMGEAEGPVRALLDEAARRHLSGVPVLYLLTVVGGGAGGAEGDPAGKGGAAPRLAGLFAGGGPESGGREAYLRAAALSARLNIDRVAFPIRRCLVELDPEEYRSTWLGNKAVYRTRMALADGAELFVLARGVDRFGEDPRIDALLREFGYRGTPATLAAVESGGPLSGSLAAAAHLVHGSSEGRFRITYCTESLSRAEVEGVGYAWADPDEVEAAFGLGPGRPRPAAGPALDPRGLPYFYVPDPARGLWKLASR